jgi:hypothetical protein
LSADISGCRPCDCDVGGATSEECDAGNGQCSCKPNIVGRQCDQPRPEYYFGKLDYFLYEAEEALGIGVSNIDRYRRSTAIFISYVSKRNVFLISMTVFVLSPGQVKLDLDK